MPNKPVKSIEKLDLKVDKQEEKNRDQIPQFLASSNQKEDAKTEEQAKILSESTQPSKSVLIEKFG